MHAIGAVPDNSGYRQESRKRPHPDSCDEMLPPGKVSKSKPSTFSENRAGSADVEGLMYFRHSSGGAVLPTDKAISLCGLAYRGDSRTPEEIFSKGFLFKGSPKIDDDSVFFSMIKSAKIKPCEVKHSFLAPDQWAPDPKTTVCLTNNPLVASYFPSPKGKKYVYCCYINNGVKLYEIIDELKDTNNHVDMVKCAEEIITSIVPSEHIVCAWPVENKKLIGAYSGPRFTPEFDEPIQNKSTDQCVKGYMQNNVIPELSSLNDKIVSLNSRGIVTILDA